MYCAELTVFWKDHFDYFCCTDDALYPNFVMEQCTDEAKSNILSYCATVNVCTRVQKQHFKSL
jgi:hypothetical protein